MDGYRYWVERHRLTVWLEEKKQHAKTQPEAERLSTTLLAEQEFRQKLDQLYARVRSEFEPARA